MSEACAPGGAAQVTADPASGDWVQGAVISEPDGRIVGWSGFHGPPDAEGTVEVAYAVDPDFRRQGYAKAMLARLLERASADPVVRTIRVTIRTRARSAPSGPSASLEPESSGTRRTAWSWSSRSRPAEPARTCHDQAQAGHRATSR